MKLCLLFSLWFLGLASAFAQPAPSRIAVVDLNRVLSTSNAGQASAARLKAANDERVAKITTMDKEVHTLEQELVNQSGWSQKQIEERFKLLKEKRAAVERFGQTMNQEVAEMRERELQTLEQQLKPVIAAVAREKTLDAVFNLYESGLVFAADRINITADVIARFNAAK